MNLLGLGLTPPLVDAYPLPPTASVQTSVAPRRIAVMVLSSHPNTPAPLLCEYESPIQPTLIVERPDSDGHTVSFGPM